MSRLIIKNLANSVTNEKLKEVFSEKGIVTDVQLKYTRDGKFRHFGFVGYQKDDDALQAIDYFNNTFINGSRINVQLCDTLGDPSKSKGRNKRSSDSFPKIHLQEVVQEAENSENVEKKKKHSLAYDVLKKYKDDPVFSEFIKSRSKGKQVWSNGIAGGDEQKQKKSIKKESCKNYKSESSDQNDRCNDSANSDDNDEDELSNVAKANISDMEYLKMKTKGGEDVKQEQHTENEETKIKIKKQKKKKDVCFYTVKVRGLKVNAKKSDIKQFFRPLITRSIRRPVKIKDIAYVAFATEKEMKVALKKHGSILAGRQIVVKQVGGDAKHSVMFRNSNNKWEKQAESLKNEETVAESGRIFVRNLAYSVSETDVEALFAKYGPITEVVMPIDRISRLPKGFAIITFMMPEHALKAYMELDGSILQGRMLHLIPGKNKITIEEMLEKDGLSYKEKRFLKLKTQASAPVSWNTLFLGQNAVADLIAKNYNTTKEKVLDTRGKESLAVRLALGETQIVNETRQFLLDHGVHLDAFNQPAEQRSKLVLLVKNLPAETTRQEICQLFAKFGELGRVLLPPSGVTAIVEFLEPSEARAAFRKLSFSKFKHLPLYLEWAPENSFSSPFTGKKTLKLNDETPKIDIEAPKISDDVEDCKKYNNLNEQQRNEQQRNERQRNEQQRNEQQKNKQLNEQEAMDKKDSSSDEEEDEPPEPDTTLFIKNLNYNTNEDAIKEHFKKCGPIHDATVARKRDPQDAAKFLSMGYGFIQFKKKASLEKALKSYQCSVLESNSVELKRSDRTLYVNVANTRKSVNIGKQTGSKILVRNVPFQATQAEVKELFKTFGEIKALRLPLKMAGTGEHRGFAFVEYFTKHDAKRAFKSLSQSTHLYGRRLVLEWAKTEDNVGELRKKTASQFTNSYSHYRRSKSTVEFEESGQFNE